MPGPCTSSGGARLPRKIQPDSPLALMNGSATPLPQPTCRSSTCFDFPDVVIFAILIAAAGNAAAVRNLQWQCCMRRYSTQAIWLLSLAALYLTKPGIASACIFKFIGIQSCPGCGIGSAIHHFLHFDILASLHAHPLGIPAALAIIYQIVWPFFFSNNKNKRTWTHSNYI